MTWIRYVRTHSLTLSLSHSLTLSLSHSLTHCDIMCTLQVAPRCLTLQTERFESLLRLLVHWERLHVVSSEVVSEWKELVTMQSQSHRQSSTHSLPHSSTHAPSPATASKGNPCDGPPKFTLSLPLKPHTHSTTAVREGAHSTITASHPDFLVDGVTASRTHTLTLQERGGHYMRDILNMMMPVTKHPIAKVLLESHTHSHTHAHAHARVPTHPQGGVVVCEEMYDYCTVSTSFYLMHRTLNFLSSRVPSESGAHSLSYDDVCMVVLACISVAGKVRLHIHTHSLTCAFASAPLC